MDLLHELARLQVAARNAERFDQYRGVQDSDPAERIAAARFALLRDGRVVPARLQMTPDLAPRYLNRPRAYKGARITVGGYSFACQPTPGALLLALDEVAPAVVSFEALASALYGDSTASTLNKVSTAVTWARYAIQQANLPLIVIRTKDGYSLSILRARAAVS